MVAIASASAQAGEMERKRKQTLERTRANHLSRQLQMRLQYARLKVEHGWQRQNLNEVENLYFHHSHRGTKTHYPQLSLVTVPSDDNSASSFSSNQLHVAYKTSMPQSATLNVVLDSSGQMTGLGTQGFPARTPTPPGLLPQTGVGSHDPSVTSTAPEVPPSRLRERSHTPNQSSSLAVSSISLSETISPAGSPSQRSISTAIVNPTPQRSHLSTPSSTGKISFSRTVSPPTPGSVNQVKVPLLMHKNVSSLAMHDMFSSNKQTTLTYDSFWSGLQSKSYPALTNGGSGTNAGSVNHQLLNNVVNTTTTTTTLGALSTQSFAPNLASSTTSSPPLPLVPPHLHHPSTPSSIPSSHTPTALPSASTQAPLLLSQTASFASPPQTQQLQLQMQQNRPLIDNLAVWNLIASQPYPGLMNTQQGFNTDQLAGSTTVHPFLANLSAAYAQAFNGTAEIQGSRSQGNEIGVCGNTPTPHGVGVPPSNTSASSPPVPPVASAIVGQEGS